MNKITILLLIGFSIFISCEPDAVNPSGPEIGEETEEEQEGENEGQQSIDYDNIISLDAIITSPAKFNSYYYEDVYSAIFHDPDSAYKYHGKAVIALGNNTGLIPASEISVIWRSNLDGIVYEGHLDRDYTHVLEQQLSKGYHNLSFEVQIGDNDDFISKDSISFSNHISLKAESYDFSLLLKWTKYEEDDFQSYLILEDGNLIEEIDNISTLQFLHKNVRLATPHTYQVLVKKTSGIAKPLHGSNLLEAEAGNYLRVPHFITEVAKSPNNNLIYAIVGQKNRFMDYADEYGILILEDRPEGILLQDHILKEKRFTDLVISQDGKYLFLVSRITEYITRIDLETEEIIEFYVDTFDWGLQKIDVGPDYRLYVARKSPTSGDSPMYVIDGLTGERKGYYSYLLHGDIVYNYYNNKLYHNTTVREKSVYKFTVDNDSIVREKYFSPVIPYPDDFMLISDNGKHIFWDKFQLDTDLNPVREFEDRILAIDKDNQLISNGKELINFQSLQSLFEFPLFPYHDEFNSNEIFNKQGDLIFFKPFQPYVNSFETVILKLNKEDVLEQ